MIEPTSAKNGRRGFSLAEVLVAVALLSVILLALFGLVSAGVRRAYSGKKMTQASIIAQHVMERVNVYAAHSLMGPGGGASPTTCTTSVCTTVWTRTASGTTPIDETGGTTNELERNAVRNLLATADLPVTTANPATLTVTITAVPASTTFTTASMEQIVVDLVWFEWGTRRRQVRLQALNLRTTP